MMVLERFKNILKEPRRIICALLYYTKRIWPDKLYLQLRYYSETGKILNLNSPKTFNEKLQWLKLYNRCPNYTTMVDKYAVKQYVADKIGIDYIIPTIGIWNNVEDIDWQSLPNQFVLKTTHDGGSGGVIVCKNKEKLNKVDACKKLHDSLNSDIYLNYREWPYKNVPKRIIAEKFIVDESGIELKDYKFFCFNGQVQCFKIDFDRYTSHKANYYDRDFNLLPFGEVMCPADHTIKFAKPKNFNLMLKLAESLALNIPFVRIDFYNIDGKIYFGEITFFPAAGMGKFEPEEWDEKLGKMIKLF